MSFSKEIKVYRDKRWNTTHLELDAFKFTINSRTSCEVKKVFFYVLIKNQSSDSEDNFGYIRAKPNYFDQEKMDYEDFLLGLDNDDKYSRSSSEDDSSQLGVSDHPGRELGYLTFEGDICDENLAEKYAHFDSLEYDSQADSEASGDESCKYLDINNYLQYREDLNSNKIFDSPGDKYSISGSGYVIFSVELEDDIESISLIFSQTCASDSKDFLFFAENLTSSAQFYNSSRFSDVTLVSSNPNRPQSLEDSFTQRQMGSAKDYSTSNADPEISIYAHKNILSNNSTYFNTMFAEGFQEGFTPEVQLGLSAKPLEIIVHFIYTRYVNINDIASATFKNWSEVFKNAMMMELPELGKIALWFMYGLMKPSDSIEVLRMCREHNNSGFIILDVLESVREYCAA